MLKETQTELAQFEADAERLKAVFHFHASTHVTAFLISAHHIFISCAVRQIHCGFSSFHRIFAKSLQKLEYFLLQSVFSCHTKRITWCFYLDFASFSTKHRSLQTRTSMRHPLDGIEIEGKKLLSNNNHIHMRIVH